MTRLRAALAALVLAASVLLTGCAQVAPSTTAVVGGHVIAESTIDQATQDFLQVADGDWSSTRAAVARQYVLGYAARMVAADRGIALTTSRSDDKLSKYPQLAELIALGDDLKDVRASITDEELSSAMSALEVTLNPRYGTWAAYSDLSASVAPTGSLSEISTH